MRSLTGLFNSTWWPVMTADTTAPSYWLNWRFLLCAIWILMAMVLSALVVWRYEGHNKSRSRPTGDQGEAARGSYKSEAWRTCSQSIHPIWLLAYRIVAFCALLALILADTIVHSVGIFYFYTQWTFTLVTFYFGLASSLSIHGHLLHRPEVDSEKDNRVGRDAEQGSYVEPTHGENSAVSFLSNCIFCSMDKRIRCFPVDHPCFCFDEVALSFSRLVITICSHMVRIISLLSILILAYGRTHPDKTMLFIEITSRLYGNSKVAAGNLYPSTCDIRHVS
ncbi:UNVERIFIED_CONTAM: hypothetical protein Scaly_0919100 [Sesamum calycinum]|uniref:Palmitoyltransferase n=1 Tax=Sesamum calycinum TaxID=2727403 RepID=A0AAW2QWQ1_9LAMI